MVKPIKTAGKTQKQQIAMATTMKKRSAPGVAALKQIKKQQKSTRKCIPKTTFKNLVMDITSSILAERADTTGKRNTKNSQRGNATKPSVSSTGTKSSSTKNAKGKVKREVKTEVKSDIKNKVKKEKKLKIK